MKIPRVTNREVGRVNSFTTIFYCSPFTEQLAVIVARLFVIKANTFNVP